MRKRATRSATRSGAKSGSDQGKHVLPTHMDCIYRQCAYWALTCRYRSWSCVLYGLDTPPERAYATYRATRARYNPRGNPTMKTTDDAYVDAARAALDRGDAEVLQYLTITCTECGHVTPGMSDDDRALHALHGEYVLVGCEGYRMIDPNLLGIDAPLWDDWTAYDWEIPT